MTNAFEKGWTSKQFDDVALADRTARPWEQTALEIMKEHYPALPDNLELFYIRGGVQPDGFVCIAAKFQVKDTNEFYRIHFHLGYHANADAWEYVESGPYVRIRNFIHSDGFRENPLVPLEKCYPI